MISLKKTIEDFNYRAMFESAMECCQGLVGSLEKHTISIENDALTQYRSQLDGLRKRLCPSEASQETLRSCAAGLDSALGGYRAEIETLLKGTGNDLKDVVSVLAEATESLSQRESMHSGQLSRISGSLESIAKSQDLQGIRSQLSHHVFELRTCIDRMTRDNESAVQALQQELAGFQKKLEKVQIEASTDPLTRLANRRRAAREIVSRIRDRRSFGVLLLDLNKFKQINDTYGHGSGDRVLQIVAQRLSRQVREDDMACRWGGDEFVVIQAGSGEELVARGREIGRQIGGKISLEVEGRVVEMTIGAAVGWAEYRSGETVEELLARADQSLYATKAVSGESTPPPPVSIEIAVAVAKPVPAPEEIARETRNDASTGLPGLEDLKTTLGGFGQDATSWCIGCFAIRRPGMVNAHYGYSASEKVLPHLRDHVLASKFGDRLYRGEGAYLLALVRKPAHPKALDMELRRIRAIGLEKHLTQKSRASLLPIPVVSTLIPIEPDGGISGAMEDIRRFAVMNQTLEQLAVG